MFRLDRIRSLSPSIRPVAGSPRFDHPSERIPAGSPRALAGCALPFLATLSGLLVLALLMVPTGPLLAASAEDAEDAPDETQVVTEQWLLFPEDRLHPVYVADPQRLSFALGVLTAVEDDIADTGSSRFQLRVGGQFGVLRTRPRDPRARRWQLSIEAGLDGQFDLSESLDNVGWDGNYGLTATSASPSSPWTWRLGFFHTSAHIGDELIERTGRTRVGYTRDELVAGVGRSFSDRSRGYAEAAWGSDDEGSGQEPLRLQLGWVWEAPGTLWDGRLGWYWATDFQSWEERDWRLDSAFQIGLMVPTDDNTWRAGLAVVDGRPTIGEFFRDTETWATLGVWLDL